MRLIYAEDTYGEGFYRKLVELLKKEGIIGCSISVKTPPALMCSGKIARLLKMDFIKHAQCDKIKGKTLRKTAVEAGIPLKVLIMVDSEGEPVDTVRKRVNSHYSNIRMSLCGNNYRLANLVRVGVVVVESHESWLCYGLKGSRKCRSKETAVDYLRRQLGDWRKEWLDKTVSNIDISRLTDLGDFKEFLRLLEWLCSE